MEPRNLVELVNLAESGEKLKYLFFWGHKRPQKGLDATCLSQWYSARFEEDGHSFPTAEHYMMYRKAILFDDQNSAQKVLAAGNPGKAKSIGRKVMNFREEAWVAQRETIVQKASLLKFSQNPDLKAFLLQTGTRILVEASPVDRIWGIGMDKAQGSQTHPSKWRGLNLLGFALMSARSSLKS